MFNRAVQRNEATKTLIEKTWTPKAVLFVLLHCYFLRPPCRINTIFRSGNFQGEVGAQLSGGSTEVHHCSLWFKPGTTGCFPRTGPPLSQRNRLQLGVTHSTI